MAESASGEIKKFRVVAIAGSLRAKSFNKMILRTVVELLEQQGVEVTTYDLGAPGLPLINEDLEEKQADGTLKFPAEVEEFRRIVAESDGVILATPEYNFSISAPMKNALDWLSRPANALQGKVR